jgi:PAS domain S-box-containing protein
MFWLFFLGLFIVGSGLFALAGWRDIEERQLQNLVQLNRLTRQVTEDTLLHYERIFRVIGQRVIATDPLRRPGDAQAVLREALSQYPEFAGLNIALPTGRQIVTSFDALGARLPNLLETPEATAGFAAALEQTDLVVSRTLYQERRQLWLIPMRLALRDAGGRPRLVLSGSLNIQDRNMLWNRLQLPADVRLGILRADGYLQYTTPLDMARAKLFLAEPLPPQVARVIGLLGDRNEASHPAIVGVDGVERMIAIARIVGHPLYAVTSQSRADLIPAWRNRLLVGMPLALLILLGSYAFYRYAAHLQDTEEAERLAAIATLEANEKRFFALVESAPDAIVLFDADRCTLVEANANACRLCGRSCDELRAAGINILRPQTADDAQKPTLAREWAQRLEDAGDEPFEWRCATANGDSVTCEVRLSRLPDPSRRLIRASLIDISARRQSELMLRLSQEKFANIFHGSPDYITISRADDGLILDANESFERISGWSRDDAIGRNALELGLWPKPAERDELLARLQRESSVRDMEVTLGCRDGSRKTCLLSSSTIMLGGTRHIVNTLRDITLRKQAEEALRLSEEKFSRVFQGSPDYISITRTEDGTFLDVNQGFERVSGWAREEVIGRSSIELGIWSDPAEREEMKRLLARDGGIRDFEFALGRKDGQRRIGLLSASPITVGRQNLLVAIIRDITEIKEAQRQLLVMNEGLEQRVAERTAALTAANEQLRGALATLEHAQDELVRSEKLASLGAMVAGVAHELNTPLGNSVMVATTFADRTLHFAAQLGAGQIRRSVLDDYVAQASEAAAMLTRNLQQAADLIGHFKQLAVDQTSAQRRRFELVQVVDDVLLALRPQFKNSGHRVSSEVAPDLVLDSYPGPLGQVLANLVTNALLHGLDGFAQGHIAIAARALDGGQVELTVADDGRGIPKDIQPRVFDPFFTTRLGRGGSGLGLHLVYSMVTRVLGGRIGFTSKPDEGTRFQIVVPCVAPTADASVNL